MIPGEHVISLYSYIEPTTDYFICAWQRIVMLYLFIRNKESPLYYASLKLLYIPLPRYLEMTFDSFNAFNVTATPQSVLCKYCFLIQYDIGNKLQCLNFFNSNKIYEFFNISVFFYSTMPDGLFPRWSLDFLPI